MVFSLIQKRRSIRKFIKKSVEAEKMDILVEAALRSPSSRGIYPWEFIIVTHPEMLQKLAKAKQYGSAFLENAALGIIICADPGRSDVWVEDCSIAATYIQLTAQSLDLGSCWIQIRERMHDDNQTAEGFLRRTLKIPEQLKIDSIIAIGYPDEAPPAHEKAELQFTKVHYNSYEDE
jgi:Nitroreductase